MQQLTALRVVKGTETMSATISRFQFDAVEKGQAPPVVTDNRSLFCRFGVQTQERHCPSCDSVVYTRRHRWCGVCEQVLPTNCLFDIDEAEKVDVLLRMERQRHRAWLMRIEEPRH